MASFSFLFCFFFFGCAVVSFQYTVHPQRNLREFPIFLSGEEVSKRSNCKPVSGLDGEGGAECFQCAVVVVDGWGWG